MEELLKSPLLAAIGGLVVLAVIGVPLALRLAGLSGEQIVTVIRETLGTAKDIIRALRNINNNGNGQ